MVAAGHMVFCMNMFRYIYITYSRRIKKVTKAKLRELIRNGDGKRVSTCMDIGLTQEKAILLLREKNLIGKIQLIINSSD